MNSYAPSVESHGLFSDSDTYSLAYNQGYGHGRDEGYRQGYDMGKSEAERPAQVLRELFGVITNVIFGGAVIYFIFWLVVGFGQLRERNKIEAALKSQGIALAEVEAKASKQEPTTIRVK